MICTKLEMPSNRGIETAESLFTIATAANRIDTIDRFDAQAAAQVERVLI